MLSFQKPIIKIQGGKVRVLFKHSKCVLEGRQNAEIEQKLGIQVFCQWSTEGGSIQPKLKFFTIWPSASPAKVLS